MHHGDLDKVKGGYRINAVNEVIEYQFTGCVERISENFLLPVLDRPLESLHLVVQGSHSDRGSEYVDCQVDVLLEKLHVAEFTESRLRRSNPNIQIGSLAGPPCREARCSAKGPCGTSCLKASSSHPLRNHESDVQPSQSRCLARAGRALIRLPIPRCG